MDTEETTDSWSLSIRWWVPSLLILSLLALALLPLGPLGYKFGIFSLSIAFLLLTEVVPGISVAVGSLALGTLLLSTRARQAAHRRSLLLALVATILVLGWVGNQWLTVREVPPIHDISTDLTDPPIFTMIMRGEGANSLERDNEKLAVEQKRAYPLIRPMTSTLAPAEAFQRALIVARELGWESIQADPETRQIEATDTSFWFGFKDDVVIRVTAAAGGSRIDLRSVSRIGVSDLGENANRIGAFLELWGSGHQ